VSSDNITIGGRCDRGGGTQILSNAQQDGPLLANIPRRKWQQIEGYKRCVACRACFAMWRRLEIPKNGQLPKTVKQARVGPGRLLTET